MKSFKLTPAIITFFFFIIFFFASCDKYDTDIEGDVAIYLLDEYTTGEGSRSILNSGIVLEDEPIVSYNEIISYNSVTHTFKITGAAAEKLTDLYQSAFAVTIEGVIIYTAYFWSALSSQIVDWVVTDLVTVSQSNKMEIKLGYPYLMEDMNIPDNRNDNRILSVFKRDNKLID